jgi:hypothetical protein
MVDNLVYERSRVQVVQPLFLSNKDNFIIIIILDSVRHLLRHFKLCLAARLFDDSKDYINKDCWLARLTNNSRMKGTEQPRFKEEEF